MNWPLMVDLKSVGSWTPVLINSVSKKHGALSGYGQCVKFAK